MKRRKLGGSAVDETPDLAALADGSLPVERRAALEARVAGSAELADRLGEQERAVGILRSAAAEVEAPAALRARVDAQRRVRRVSARRRVALAGALLVVATACTVGAIEAISPSPSASELHVALAPTGLAVGAAGEASLYRRPSGWQIDFDATGLPRRDGGDYYEAWLRNTSGVLVPIGTFNEGHQVTLWAGVSPKHFTRLTVTRERADDAQVSSGETVLVGKVVRG